MSMVTKAETIDNDGNRRQITLDPIRPERTIAVPVREVESTMPAGFRQDWLTGGNDEVEINLGSTAGWGGKYLTFHYTPKGGECREFVVDMEQVAELLIENAKLDERVEGLS